MRRAQLAQTRIVETLVDTHMPQHYTSGLRTSDSFPPHTIVFDDFAMAKRSHITKKKKTTRKQSLPELQRKIERLDRDVVKQVNERAKLFEKIQKLQPEDHSPIVDVDGDQTWIEQLAGGSKGPLDARTIRRILREVVSGCRELVKPLRVAYLGPAYSYSHLAARERFGSSVELVPVATISAVFKEINSHQSDFGLVPLENSTDGRVTDTLDMFARLPVRI